LVEAAKDDPKKLTDKAIFNHILMKELFRQPCKCCGSHRHGVFSVMKIGNVEKIALACPVVGDASWDRVLKYSFTTMRFQPNPKLFAQRYNSNIDGALQTFRSRGYGKHMEYMQLVDFENDVYCEALRLNGDGANKKPQM